jgi:hypothetical protein
MGYFVPHRQDLGKFASSVGLKVLLYWDLAVPTSKTSLFDGLRDEGPGDAKK